MVLERKSKFISLGCSCAHPLCCVDRATTQITEPLSAWDLCKIHGTAQENLWHLAPFVFFIQSCSWVKEEGNDPCNWKEFIKNYQCNLFPNSMMIFLGWMQMILQACKTLMYFFLFELIYTILSVPFLEYAALFLSSLISHLHWLFKRYSVFIFQFVNSLSIILVPTPIFHLFLVWKITKYYQPV